jgi:hypothetical protein
MRRGALRHWVEEQPLDGVCVVAKRSHRFREFEVGARIAEFQGEERHRAELPNTDRGELRISCSDEVQKPVNI